MQSEFEITEEFGNFRLRNYSMNDGILQETYEGKEQKVFFLQKEISLSFHRHWKSWNLRHIRFWQWRQRIQMRSGWNMILIKSSLKSTSGDLISLSLKKVPWSLTGNLMSSFTENNLKGSIWIMIVLWGCWWRKLKRNSISQLTDKCKEVCIETWG